MQAGKRASPARSRLAGDSAADQAPRDWNIGDTILDVYEITGLLAEGGMGRVYKVHHRGWNTDLAVKSPRPEIFATAGGKENFIREAETWVNLGLHPHTVSCYYVRTLSGIPRVFAEYVEGGSLADWIRTRKLYEGGPEKALERILDIAIQFAWGLHYAHEQGLVHQDVKPANVMMTTDGTAKVTDFGLAKARGLAGEAAVAAAAGAGRSILVSVGGMTPAYCSPEQARGDALSRRTDIWSWGSSVLEMFTGEVTWLAGQATPEALEAHLQSGSEDAAIPPMPAPLAELLKQCFQQEPERRPRSMQQIVSALRQVYQQVTGGSFDRHEPKAVELTADSWNNRALSYLDLERRAEAHEAWKQALAADPQHPEATYNRGVVRWRNGELTDEDLLRALERVRATRRKQLDPTHLLALVHLERGDVEAAVPMLEETIRQAPEATELQETLRLARSGALVAGRCLGTFEGHKGPHGVNSVCLSADGRWALAAGEDSPKVVRGCFLCISSLYLWDLDTGRLRSFEGHQESVNSVCLSADERYALSGSSDNTVRLWEVATGRCLRSFEAHVQFGVTCVALSGDGRLALCGGFDAALGLWEVATGRCLGILLVPHGVECACLTRDGQWALSGGPDCNIRLWEVATRRCVRTFEGHTGCVYSICLSADERYVLSGGTDGLKLWDVTTGQCLRTFGGQYGVASVCLSADGCWALSGGGHYVRLWEVATGRCLRTFEGHTAGVNSVCLRADGRSALSGSSDGTMRLWELPQPTGHPGAFPLRLSRVRSHVELVVAENRVAALLKKSQRALVHTQFAPALDAVRKARSVPGHERTPQTLGAWARLYGFCRRVGFRAAWPAETFEGHTSGVNSVCLSADGRLGLSGSQDNTLRLWKVGTGQCLRTFEGHSDAVSSVCLSIDGRYALSGSQDKTLRLWNVGTGQWLRAFEGHSDVVSSVCLSIDGRYALSGSQDKTLRLWNVATGCCLRIFGGHKVDVYSVCLSADGRYALSGGGDGLKLWDVSTGRCLRTFGGREYGINSVCLRPDGGLAISGDSENMLRLWEVSTGNCVGTCKGHTDQVWSVCLSVDGRYAVSASFDGTARLWEVATGRCLCAVEQGPAWSVSLSQDGRWALVGNSDNTVGLWELDWELEAPLAADWDDGAQVHLETFLSCQTPYAGSLGQDRKPSEEEIELALTRHGKPAWDEKDFKQLLYTLGCAGYGWLRPEGVRRKLEEMAANWQGPSPLAGETKTTG